MNKQDALQFLLSILSSFYVHPLLAHELIDHIGASGKEPKIFALLTARLLQLSAMGAETVRLKEFESIGEGLFSMHLTGSGFNIRILYSFFTNRDPVLLHAFYERGGKNKTDYSTHIPIAKERFNQMKRELQR